jgi:hypothetical protein
MMLNLMTKIMIDKETVEQIINDWVKEKLN